MVGLTASRVWPRHAANHEGSGAFRTNGLLLKRAMECFSLELEATEVFYGKTNVVGLVEMSRLVKVPERASHVLSPSVTALCERL